MQQKSLLLEYVEALVVAFALAMLIRTFVVQAYKIPSGSMLETLQIGDHLLVNKFSYGVKLPFTHKVVLPVGDPQRGDIIVFEYPGDPSIDYIKRIVGQPGDVIEVRNKQLYRNGEAVQEAYIRHSQPGIVMPVRDSFGPVTVPEGHYFAMGDNRDDSQDSRFWGFVPRGAIRGKAWVIYWSWEGLGNVRWDRIGTVLH
ncbi:signal peptidase I [Nitratidesulfovibrio sp.]|uniref:signal peptidase I n=1 Tax=Nitratidesulfovibrio sp. TaxID=2802297 RepID=UPI00334073FB